MNLKNYIVACFVLMSGSMFGQAGMRVHTGLTMATTSETNITPSGTAHYGYHVGVDFRLFAETGMFFSGGIQYHKLNIIAQDSPAFFSSEPSLQLLKLRWGLGYYIFNRDNSIIKVRTKLMGVLDYVYDYNRDALVGREPYNKINDSSLGALVGLGVDISHFTIDLAYQKGFINAYYKVPDSKIDYFTLSLGFFF